MNSHTFEIVRGTILLVILASAVLFVLYRWLKGSKEPLGLMFRWVLTAIALFGFFRGALESRAAFQRGDPSAAVGVIYGLLAGIFLAVVWVPVVVGFVSRKIGNLFDGGDVEVDPAPFYSIFEAKRAKGLYFEALNEVRRQLERFPNDFEGQMHLAALQAEHLDDLPGAQVTIERLCAQPGHSPVNIADALNRLADWNLKYLKDREGAVAVLQRVLDLLPGSEQALVASQRIARISNAEAGTVLEGRAAVHVAKGVENLGLTSEQAHLKRAEKDPAQEASDYVQHLVQHPLDAHAREKLALIYAQHFHRLDLALDQLEQLVGLPNQQPKNVIHWLNLMADLQVQESAPPEQVHDTLQRIINLYPDLAAAETARRRINSLKLEFRRQDEGRKVRLGNYEQNIGLKPSSTPPGDKPAYTPIK